MHSKHANPRDNAPETTFHGYSPEAWAWFAAILIWGLGDLTTTLVGLQLVGVAESNPVGQALYQGLGPVGLLLGKLVVLGVLLLLRVAVPREWRLGIPIGLLWVGLLAVFVNTWVILGVVLA